MTTTTSTTPARAPGLDEAIGAPVEVDHRLDVDLEPAGRVLVAHLHGRLDWVTAGTLRDAVTGREAWRALVLDLTDLHGLDSHGTSSLVLSALEAKRRDGVLVVAVHDPAITDVLLAVGLGLAVPIVPSVDEARSLVGSRLHHPSMG